MDYGLQAYMIRMNCLWGNQAEALFILLLSHGESITDFLIKNIFEPAVKKAWTALCANVNEWGRLGYVQQVAGDPYPFFEYQWQVYATGAFLLCGREMVTLLNSAQ